MSSGKICTRTEETMQAPPKSIKSRIKENTIAKGEVLCIKCEASNFKEELKSITYSEQIGPKKTIKLKTYRCGLCTYEVINDKEVQKMRNKLK